jgi:hypothetical protein
MTRSLSRCRVVKQHWLALALATGCSPTPVVLQEPEHPGCFEHQPAIVPDGLHVVRCNRCEDVWSRVDREMRRVCERGYALDANPATLQDDAGGPPVESVLPTG